MIYYNMRNKIMDQEKSIMIRTMNRENRLLKRNHLNENQVKFLF